MSRLCRVFSLFSVISFTTCQTIWAEPLPITDKTVLERIDQSKRALSPFEREAARNITSVTKDGVTLAIKLKAVEKKDTSDIEVAWTITNKKHRSPFYIVQPSLELPTGQTMLILYAFAKGQQFGFPTVVMSPVELIMPPDIHELIGPYRQVRKKLPPLPFIDLTTRPTLRTKDWFVKVPKGESAQGKLTISGKKLKELVLKRFPRQFDSKEPPRFFLQMIHDVSDDGYGFPLKAWTGELIVLYNKVPGLKKW